MKKRFKGLLCLLLSMTMLFGMTLGVNASAADYSYDMVHDSSATSTYFTSVTFTTSGGDTVQAGAEFLKGQTICFLTSGSIKIYIDGIQQNALGYVSQDQTYELPSTAEKYIYTQIEITDISRSKLYFTSIKSEQTQTQTSTHSHTYEWQTVKEATETEDGEEIYACSCGDIADRRVKTALSCYWENNLSKINSAKSGDTITIDSDIWCSFPKKVLETIAAQKNVTVKIRFKYKNVKYEVTIPAGTEIDTSFDYYGPEKMKQKFGYSIIE